MLANILKSSLTAIVPPLTASFTNGYRDDIGGETIEFTNVDFGAEDSTRRIYVFVLARASSTRSLSSMTIGGVSATFFIGNSSNSLGPYAVYAADVPTGTSGTVSVTFNGAVNTTIISVYRVLNQTTAIGSVVVDSAASLGLTVTSRSLSIATDARGFALVGINLSAARSISTFGWTQDYETGITQLKAGLGVVSPTSGSITYSATWSGTTNATFIVISFRK
jgi:hypothetical protein